MSVVCWCSVCNGRRKVGRVTRWRHKKRDLLSNQENNNLSVGSESVEPRLEPSVDDNKIHQGDCVSIPIDNSSVSIRSADPITSKTVVRVQKKMRRLVESEGLMDLPRCIGGIRSRFDLPRSAMSVITDLSTSIYAMFEDKPSLDYRQIENLLRNTCR